MSNYEEINIRNIINIKNNNMLLEELNRDDRRFKIFTDYILSDPTKAGYIDNAIINEDLLIESSNNNIHIITQPNKKVNIYGETYIRNKLISSNSEFIGDVLVEGETTLNELKVNNYTFLKNQTDISNLKVLNDLEVDKDCNFLQTVNVKALNITDKSVFNNDASFLNIVDISKCIIQTELVCNGDASYNKLITMDSLISKKKSIIEENLQVDWRINTSKIFINEQEYIFNVTVKTETTGDLKKFLIDGIETPQLKLLRGRKYIFKQDDSSNFSFPLRFYRNINRYDIIENNKIEISDIQPGNAGSFISIIIPDIFDNLYFSNNTTPSIDPSNIIFYDYLGNTYPDLGSSITFYEKQINITGDGEITNLNIIENIDISDSITVENDGIIKRNFIIYNDLSVNNQVDVSALKIFNRLDVDGDISFNSNLQIVNDVLIEHDLSVNNQVDVSALKIFNRLDVDGDISFNSNLQIVNDVLIEHDLSVNNQVDVSGLKIFNRLDVDGDISFNSNLQIVNDVLIEHDLSVNNKVDVSGLKIFNRLDVDGDISFNNNLQIVNDVFIQHDLSVNNQVDVSGLKIFNRLDVLDDVSLNKNVEITNDLLIKHDLNVNNQVDVSGLKVFNRLDVLDDVSLNKNVEISNDLLIKHDLSVNNQVDVSGIKVYNRLDVLYDVSLNKNVEISNDLLIKHDLNVNNQLDVSGLKVFNRLDVLDDVSLNKDVEITNDLLIKHDLNVNNQVDVSGLKIFNRLDVLHDVSLNKDVEITNDLLIKHDLNVNNQVDVSGLKVFNRLDVLDDVSLNKNVEISNDLSIKHDLSVNNIANFNNVNILNKLEVEGDVSLNINLQVDNDVLIKNDLSVNKIANFNNVNILNNLEVDGDVSLNSNIEISNNLFINNKTISKDLSINNIANINFLNIKNNLSVDKDTTFNKDIYVTDMSRDRTIIEPILRNSGIDDEGIDNYFENNIRVLKIDTETNKLYYGEVDFSGSDVRVTIDGIIEDYLSEKIININNKAFFNNDISLNKNVEISNNLLVKEKSYFKSNTIFRDDIILVNNDLENSEIIIPNPPIENNKRMIYGPGIIGIDPSPYDYSSSEDKGKVIIYGNLEVMGKQTIINTEVLQVKDNVIRTNLIDSTGGLEIYNIDAGEFIANFKYNHVTKKWTTSNTDLTVGTKNLLSNKIKTNEIIINDDLTSINERVSIPKLFSNDLSSNLSFINDLTVVNMNKIKMTDEIDLSDNKIKNIKSLHGYGNNYLKISSDLFFELNKNLLLNSNNINNINDISGINKILGSQKLILNGGIDEKIDFSNNTLINIGEIEGYGTNSITLLSNLDANEKSIDNIKTLSGYDDELIIKDGTELRVNNIGASNSDLEIIQTNDDKQILIANEADNPIVLEAFRNNVNSNAKITLNSDKIIINDINNNGYTGSEEFIVQSNTSKIESYKLEINSNNVYIGKSTSNVYIGKSGSNIIVNEDVNFNSKNLTNINSISTPSISTSSSTNDITFNNKNLTYINSISTKSIKDKNNSPGTSNQVLTSDNNSQIVWTSLPPIDPTNLSTSYYDNKFYITSSTGESAEIPISQGNVHNYTSDGPGLFTDDLFYILKNVQADWIENDETSDAFIKHKPSLFDGDYNSLNNLPSLFNGDYNSLNNLPSLFNGNYNSLTNLPSLFDGNYNSLTNKPNIIENLYNSYSTLKLAISTRVVENDGRENYDKILFSSSDNEIKSYNGQVTRPIAEVSQVGFSNYMNSHIAIDLLNSYYTTDQIVSPVIEPYIFFKYNSSFKYGIGSQWIFFIYPKDNSSSLKITPEKFRGGGGNAFSCNFEELNIDSGNISSCICLTCTFAGGYSNYLSERFFISGSIFNDYGLFPSIETISFKESHSLQIEFIWDSQYISYDNSTWTPSYVHTEQTHGENIISFTTNNDVRSDGVVMKPFDSNRGYCLTFELNYLFPRENGAFKNSTNNAVSFEIWCEYTGDYTIEYGYKGWMMGLDDGYGPTICVSESRVKDGNISCLPPGDYTHTFQPENPYQGGPISGYKNVLMHIIGCWKWNGSGVEESIYINSEYVAIRNNHSSLPNMSPSARRMHIGGRNNPTNHGCYGMKVYSARVWHTKLDQTTVNRLYAAGKYGSASLVP